MSVRANTCQIVPTTFHGTSKGNAMTTIVTASCQPRRGMHNATRMPSGTSIARITPENTRLRTSASRNRPPSSREGSSNSRNQPMPFQKNWLLPKLSCTE